MLPHAPAAGADLGVGPTLQPRMSEAALKAALRPVQGAAILRIK